MTLDVTLDTKWKEHGEEPKKLLKDHFDGFDPTAMGEPIMSCDLMRKRLKVHAIVQTEKTHRDRYEELEDERRVDYPV